MIDETKSKGKEFSAGTLYHCPMMLCRDLLIGSLSSPVRLIVFKRSICWLLSAAKDNFANPCVGELGSLGFLRSKFNVVSSKLFLSSPFQFPFMLAVKRSKTSGVL